MIQQSSTAWELLFLMVQSSDHITALTGASPTVTIRKAGGSYAAPAGAVSEVANGLYKVAGNATDTNTLGSLWLHATAASGDPTDTSYEIVAFNPQSATLGLTIPTTAQIATGVWQDTTSADFTAASSIGKSLFTSGAAPGAAGGLFIAGTNAATSITTGLTAHIIGTVDTVTTYTGNTPQTGDNFARVGAPVGASISADVAAIKGVLPAALVSGRIDASVGAMAANVLTATAIAADAITDAKVAADVTISAVTGAVGSVGAGGISAASFAAGAIDSAAIATDAIGSAELAAGAVTKIQSGLSTLDAAGVRSALGVASANVDTQLSGINAKTTNLPSAPADETLIITATNAIMTRIGAAGAGLTALGDARLGNLDAAVSSRSVFSGGAVASVTGNVGGSVGSLGATAKTDVAAATWDAVLAAHLTAGTMGATLNAAGAAGDPWSVPIPGAYGGGTAGFILGTTLDANVSSRAAAASAPSGLSFPMTDATTHALKTGLSTIASRSIDGGAYAACVNLVTEIGAGTYHLALDPADTAGAAVMFLFTASGADPRLIEVLTSP